MVEALEWFGQPQRGDSMLVLGADDAFRGSRTSFRKAHDALIARGIRLFALHFGWVLAGTYYTFASGNPNRCCSSFSTVGGSNTEALPYLSWNTGGYMVIENAQGTLQRYKLSDERTAYVSQLGWQMYGSMVEIYVVTVEMLPDGTGLAPWQLDVSPSIRSKVPDAVVAYPAKLRPCSPASR